MGVMKLIGMRARTKSSIKKVRAKAKTASIKSLGHAAGTIRKTARRSIRKGKKSSTPGTPPHTRKGQIRRSILYSVEKELQMAIIGPSSQLVGDIAQAHEHGGRQKPKFRKPFWALRRGGVGPIRRTTSGFAFARLETARQVQRARELAPQATAFYRQRYQSQQPNVYPKRPFMGPALDKTRARLPRHWAGSVR